MPLSERARIEVYLPDRRPARYRQAIAAVQGELTATFGGCTTIRGLDGQYVCGDGEVSRERMAVVYADTMLGLHEHFAELSAYVEQLRAALHEATDEESILVTVFGIHHVE